ncbi:MAG: sugar ABC transporter permease [Clostridiaceae bacterium]|jgi:putative aldouronate transport system permease protein|nr:sugar ABC transporter permease [Clostridiaceae bacterium]
MIRNYQLYLLVLPTVLYYIIFKYIPMYGIQIAFRDYIATRGFTGSPFVGFEHFERFFRSPDFWLLIRNTIGLSLYQLIAGFPLPILVALLLNHLNSEKFKKFTQTVIYAPHFISTVVLVGMLHVFLSPRSGLINLIITTLGGESIFFMAKPEWFKTLYVSSGIWQNTGWGTIVYLAALSSVSPELHESAVVDGANKWRRIWYIDIPGLMPTAVILLILNMGSLMNIGFEKAYLMQSALNRSSSEIISTYVYKIGLLGAQYSFSSAVGLFDSVINLIILLTVNRVAKKATEVSLW